MDIKKGSRIAVIGAGISGIAAASILKKNGYEAVVFEKYDKLGEFGQQPIRKFICRIFTTSIIYPISIGPSNLTCIRQASK